MRTQEFLHRKSKSPPLSPLQSHNLIAVNTKKLAPDATSQGQRLVEGWERAVQAFSSTDMITTGNKRWRITVVTKMVCIMSPSVERKKDRAREGGGASQTEGVQIQRCQKRKSERESKQTEGKSARQVVSQNVVCVCVCVCTDGVRHTLLRSTNGTRALLPARSDRLPCPLFFPHTCMMHTHTRTQGVSPRLNKHTEFHTPQWCA